APPGSSRLAGRGVGRVEQQPPREVLPVELSRAPRACARGGVLASRGDRRDPRARHDMSVRHWLISVRVRLRKVFLRRRLERELDDEFAFHLAMKQDEFTERGADTARASNEARRQFGNVASLKEQSREMWTFPSLESFMHDIRYALRMLVRSP